MTTFHRILWHLELYGIEISMQGNRRNLNNGCIQYGEEGYSGCSIGQTSYIIRMDIKICSCCDAISRVEIDQTLKAVEDLDFLTFDQVNCSYT